MESLVSILSGVVGVVLWGFVILVIVAVFTGGMALRNIKVSDFFETDEALPAHTTKLADERTLAHARSPVGRAQVFITNKRVLVYARTSFAIAWALSYIPVSTITHAGMAVRNPWPLLVVAALGLVGSAVIGGSASATAIGLIWAAVFSVVWWFLRGSAIVISGHGAKFRISSKSEEGLAGMLQVVDRLRLHEEGRPQAGL